MNQTKYELKIKTWIKKYNLAAEHLSFEQSCHSVAEAAKAANVTPDEFVKNICMTNDSGKIFVAIVKGEDKVSITKVCDFFHIDKLRMLSPDEVLKKTGYPCGGTPSFGYDAWFIIDSRVMEKDVVYSGGGSENSLIKISTKEL